ncbi:MAG: hypothetical protein BGO10_05990 [Chlamydia sp. 32-24]|nr:MAG: hypothetical protein BGO10_05990 [Chlamydia sp. 32-24]
MKPVNNLFQPLQNFCLEQNDKSEISKKCSFAEIKKTNYEFIVFLIKKRLNEKYINSDYIELFFKSLIEKNKSLIQKKITSLVHEKIKTSSLSLMDCFNEMSKFFTTSPSISLIGGYATYLINLIGVEFLKEIELEQFIKVMDQHCYSDVDFRISFENINLEVLHYYFFLCELFAYSPKKNDIYLPQNTPKNLVEELSKKVDFIINYSQDEFGYLHINGETENNKIDFSLTFKRNTTTLFTIDNTCIKFSQLNPIDVTIENTVPISQIAFDILSKSLQLIDLANTNWKGFWKIILYMVKGYRFTNKNDFFSLATNSLSVKDSNLKCIHMILELSTHFDHSIESIHAIYVSLYYTNLLSEENLKIILQKLPDTDSLNSHYYHLKKWMFELEDYFTLLEFSALISLLISKSKITLHCEEEYIQVKQNNYCYYFPCNPEIILGKVKHLLTNKKEILNKDFFKILFQEPISTEIEEITVEIPFYNSLLKCIFQLFNSSIKELQELSLEVLLSLYQAKQFPIDHFFIKKMILLCENNNLLLPSLVSFFSAFISNYNLFDLSILLKTFFQSIVNTCLTKQLFFSLHETKQKSISKYIIYECEFKKFPVDVIVKSLIHIAPEQLDKVFHLWKNNKLSLEKSIYFGDLTNILQNLYLNKFKYYYKIEVFTTLEQKFEITINGSLWQNLQNPSLFFFLYNEYLENKNKANKSIDALNVLLANVSFQWNTSLKLVEIIENVSLTSFLFILTKNIFNIFKSNRMKEKNDLFFENFSLINILEITTIQLKKQDNNNLLNVILFEKILCEIQLKNSSYLLNLPEQLKRRIYSLIIWFSKKYKEANFSHIIKFTKDQSFIKSFISTQLENKKSLKDIAIYLSDFTTVLDSKFLSYELNVFLDKALKSLEFTHEEFVHLFFLYNEIIDKENYTSLIKFFLKANLSVSNLTLLCKNLLKKNIYDEEFKSKLFLKLLDQLVSYKDFVELFDLILISSIPFLKLEKYFELLKKEFGILKFYTKLKQNKIYYENYIKKNNLLCIHELDCGDIDLALSLYNFISSDEEIIIYLKKISNISPIDGKVIKKIENNFEKISKLLLKKNEGSLWLNLVLLINLQSIYSNHLFKKTLIYFINEKNKIHIIFEVLKKIHEIKEIECNFFFDTILLNPVFQLLNTCKNLPVEHLSLIKKLYEKTCSLNVAISFHPYEFFLKIEQYQDSLFYLFNNYTTGKISLTDSQKFFTEILKCMTSKNKQIELFNPYIETIKKIKNDELVALLFDLYEQIIIQENAKIIFKQVISLEIFNYSFFAKLFDYTNNFSLLEINKYFDILTINQFYLVDFDVFIKTCIKILESLSNLAFIDFMLKHGKTLLFRIFWNQSDIILDQTLILGEKIFQKFNQLFSFNNVDLTLINDLFIFGDNLLVKRKSTVIAYYYNCLDIKLGLEESFSKKIFNFALEKYRTLKKDCFKESDFTRINSLLLDYAFNLNLIDEMICETILKELIDDNFPQNIFIILSYLPFINDYSSKFTYFIFFKILNFKKNNFKNLSSTQKQNTLLFIKRNIGKINPSVYDLKELFESRYLTHLLFIKLKNETKTRIEQKKITSFEQMKPFMKEFIEEAYDMTVNSCFASHFLTKLNEIIPLETNTDLFLEKALFILKTFFPTNELGFDANLLIDIINKNKHLLENQLNVSTNNDSIILKEKKYSGGVDEISKEAIKSFIKALLDFPFKDNKLQLTALTLVNYLISVLVNHFPFDPNLLTLIIDTSFSKLATGSQALISLNCKLCNYHWKIFSKRALNFSFPKLNPNIIVCNDLYMLYTFWQNANEPISESNEDFLNFILENISKNSDRFQKNQHLNSFLLDAIRMMLKYQPNFYFKGIEKYIIYSLGLLINNMETDPYSTKSYNEINYSTQILVILKHKKVSVIKIGNQICKLFFHSSKKYPKVMAMSLINLFYASCQNNLFENENLVIHKMIFKYLCKIAEEHFFKKGRKDEFIASCDVVKALDFLAQSFINIPESSSIISEIIVEWSDLYTKYSH